MSVLMFEPEGHKYTLLDSDGGSSSELPSVTTMLKSVGIIDDKFYTDQGAHNGSRRHALTELIDTERIDWGSVLPEDIPFVEAWEGFKSEYNAKWDLIEQPMYHEIYRYAGTVDRLGTCKGCKCVVDIKTGAKADWHHLQGCLYLNMVDAVEAEVAGYIVYLKKSGKYEAVPIDMGQMGHALGIISVIAWKVAHGKSI